MADDLDQFVRVIRTSRPDLKINLDRAVDPDSEVFVDLADNSTFATIAYRRLQGFGFFGDAPGFGERPERWLSSAEDAAHAALLLMRDQKEERHLQEAARPAAPHGLIRHFFALSAGDVAPPDLLSRPDSNAKCCLF